MAPLRKCIATVALSGNLPNKPEAAAAIGFGGVEVMEADLLSSTDSPAGLAGIDHVVQALPAGRAEGRLLDVLLTESRRVATPAEARAALGLGARA